MQKKQYKNETIFNYISNQDFHFKTSRILIFSSQNQQQI